MDTYKCLLFIAYLKSNCLRAIPLENGEKLKIKLVKKEKKGRIILEEF